VLEGVSCSQHRTSIGDIGGIFVVDYIISGFIRFQDQLKAMENYTNLYISIADFILRIL
jgi:hypothetical protein